MSLLPPLWKSITALKMPWSAGILPAFGAHFHGFRVPVSGRA
jgi:hypothetical protein